MHNSLLRPYSSYSLIESQSEPGQVIVWGGVTEKRCARTVSQVEDDPIPIMYEGRGTEAGEQVNRDDPDARIGQTAKATSKQLRGREAD